MEEDTEVMPTNNRRETNNYSENKMSDVRRDYDHIQLFRVFASGVSQVADVRRFEIKYMIENPNCIYAAELFVTDENVASAFVVYGDKENEVLRRMAIEASQVEFGDRLE